MFLLGLSVSEAALENEKQQVNHGFSSSRLSVRTYMATSSTLWKLKAACTRTDKMAKNLSVAAFSTSPARAMAPGFFQYWNPIRVRSGPPPSVMTRPVTISTMIKTTGWVFKRERYVLICEHESPTLHQRETKFRLPEIPHAEKIERNRDDQDRCDVSRSVARLPNIIPVRTRVTLALILALNWQTTYVFVPKRKQDCRSTNLRRDSNRSTLASASCENPV